MWERCIKDKNIKLSAPDSRCHEYKSLYETEFKLLLTAQRKNERRRIKKNQSASPVSSECSPISPFVPKNIKEVLLSGLQVFTPIQQTACPSVSVIDLANSDADSPSRSQAAPPGLSIPLSLTVDSLTSAALRSANPAATSTAHSDSLSADWHSILQKQSQIQSKLQWLQEQMQA